MTMTRFRLLVWSFLLYFFALPVSCTSFLTTPRSRNGVSFPKHHKVAVNRQLFILHVPRGGDNLLGPTSATPPSTPGSTTKMDMLINGGGVTATAASTFLGLNGVILLANPNFLLQKIYQISPESDPASKEFSTWLMRGIGAIGLGVSFQLVGGIMFSKDVTTLQAMGLGLLPRAVFYLVAFANGSVAKLNINKRFFTINTVLTCWAVASLTFGLGNPPTTAKVFSAMLVLKSLGFVVNPAKACQKFLGVKCEGKSLALCRGLGNELLTSAVLMALTTWTPIPVGKAAGYVSLLWVMLLLDVAFIDKTWRLMESEGPQAQVAQIIIAGVLAAGFLIGK